MSIARHFYASRVHANRFPQRLHFVYREGCIKALAEHLPATFIGPTVSVYEFLQRFFRLRPNKIS